MSPQENPFTSKIFVETWIRHFSKPTDINKVGFIKNISFYKHRHLPLKINVGRNLTKGISYEFISDSQDSCGSNALLIYDIPTYFGTPEHSLPNNIGCYKIRQYPGYLIDLSPFKNLEEYLQHQFSKPSRYKLKKYRKRLESAFDIEYVTYFKQINRDTYDQLFQRFRSLLEKRFQDKEISNNNLDPSEWGFYRDVAYPMILDGKASLFVIYAGGEPIAITLNYLSSDILFDAITVFDIDYSKFHIGSITILAQIEWCLANSRAILDFSKGHFDYKENWATKSYHFEYHIYYALNYPISRIMAWCWMSMLALKQKFREWRLNEYLHRFTFWLRNRNLRKLPQPKDPYQAEKWEHPIDKGNLDMINMKQSVNPSLRLAVFDFLYLYQEHIRDVSLYQSREVKGSYFICGKSHQAKLIFETGN